METTIVPSSAGARAAFGIDNARLDLEEGR